MQSLFEIQKCTQDSLRDSTVMTVWNDVCSEKCKMYYIDSALEIDQECNTVFRLFVGHFLMNITNWGIIFNYQ